MLHIFYKLPVKQLHRIKIVCKRWSSLISNPSFGSEFSIRAISPTLSMFLTCSSGDDCFHTKHLTNDGKSWFQERKDPFKFIHKGEQKGKGKDKVQCFGSSNGLVLCGVACKEKRKDFTYLYYLSKVQCFCFYYVCNLTTKQWISVPSPPSCKSFVLSGFVCNPNSEVHNSETWFKVVRFIDIRWFNDPTNSRDLTLEIFDSATNQWKVLKIQLNNSVIVHQRVDAIEHRGMLYWECRKSNLVIIFDPNVDRCYELLIPGSFGQQIHHKLDVSRNDLYYIELDFRKHHNPSTIWRCDELEGKPTWVVHRSFVLHDWTLETSVWRFKWRNDRIDLTKYVEPQKVLGVDSVDCNIIYISIWHDPGCKIYSMDVRRKKMENISSTNRVIRSFISVQPSWPTIVPNLPSL